MVNEWTRNDLPNVVELLHSWNMALGDGYPSLTSHVLDSVVEHLNTNGGVPVSREDAALADRLERQATSIARLQGELETAEGDRSRWRRAHGLVEQERITARAELAEAQLDRDSWRDRVEAAECERDEYRDGMYAAQRHHEKVEEHLVALAEVAERSRDAWKARAEAAEARTEKAEPSWDAEDCDACTEVQDLCWYHRGVVAGTSWVSERLAAIASDPELLNLIPARAIEAGQATDPVEQQAERLYVEYWGGDRAHLPWSHQDEEGREGFLRLARHVLGQEASDE